MQRSLYSSWTSQIILVKILHNHVQLDSSRVTVLSCSISSMSLEQRLKQLWLFSHCLRQQCSETQRHVAVAHEKPWPTATAAHRLNLAETEKASAQCKVRVLLVCFSLVRWFMRSCRRKVESQSSGRKSTFCLLNQAGVVSLFISSMGNKYQKWGYTHRHTLESGDFSDLMFM